MQAHSSESPVGILLLQLGGPSDLVQVEPFIRALLADPAVVRLPFFMRPFQASLARRWAARRAPEVLERYRLIGGGSPLVETTRRLAAALEKRLAEQKGLTARVVPAFRFGGGTLEKELSGLRQAGVKELLIVSLYPQYSHTTTGSGLSQLERALKDSAGWRPPRRLVSWYDHPGYIELLEAQVREAVSIQRLSDEQYLKETALLCSAHGLPEQYVRKGDPYRDQVTVTFKALQARLEPLRCWLGFQSEMGPRKWIKPYSRELIPQLHDQGCRRLLVLPLGFVCDHIETMYDMDVVLRQEARAAGIEEFLRLPAYNAKPPFVELLSNMIMEKLDPRAGGDPAD